MQDKHRITRHDGSKDILKSRSKIRRAYSVELELQPRGAIRQGHYIYENNKVMFSILCSECNTLQTAVAVMKTLKRHLHECRCGAVHYVTFKTGESWVKKYV